MYIYIFVLITFCVITIVIISIFISFFLVLSVVLAQVLFHVSRILKLYVNFSKFDLYHVSTYTSFYSMCPAFTPCFNLLLMVLSLQSIPYFIICQPLVSLMQHTQEDCGVSEKITLGCFARSGKINNYGIFYYLSEAAIHL